MSLPIEISELSPSLQNNYRIGVKLLFNHPLEWLKYGITMPNANLWIAYGFLPHEAFPWFCKMFTPLLSSKWKSIGYDVESATALIMIEVFFDEARKWKQFGFNVNEIIELHNHGFTPESAVQLRNQQYENLVKKYLPKKKDAEMLLSIGK